ncbi:hypothetical protein Bbelb_039370 [Branchiostoma belcheri]|nr:hypothetical protein Bbelb_039370 [Branchiostoma belcheri]
MRQRLACPLVAVTVVVWPVEGSVIVTVAVGDWVLMNKDTTPQEELTTNSSETTSPHRVNRPQRGTPLNGVTRPILGQETHFIAIANNDNLGDGLGVYDRRRRNKVTPEQPRNGRVHPPSRDQPRDGRYSSIPKGPVTLGELCWSVPLTVGTGAEFRQRSSPRPKCGDKNENTGVGLAVYR